MDEPIMLKWGTNSFDKFFEDQLILSTNNDQVGFAQHGNNNKSKPIITLQFGAQDNLISKDLTEKGIGIVPQTQINNNQDHILAERKRRAKLNQRFVELSSIIPSLKKTDKASILNDAVNYVKELEGKVKTLENRNPKPNDSIMIVKNSSPSSEAPHDLSTFAEPLPRIEARFFENTILLSIHCANVKGVLVKILAEIEEHNLMVTHTNLVSFPQCTAFITITAQIEEGYNTSVEHVVTKLDSALKLFR